MSSVCSWLCLSGYLFYLIALSAGFSIDRECSFGRQRSKIDITVSIDRESEMVEIILKCHPDKWCGIAFDAEVMNDKPCTIISQPDAPYATEWELGNYKQGTLQTEDTVSNISVITDSDWRTVTMTRPITNSLYSFDHSDDSIPIIWAMSEEGETEYGGFHQAWGCCVSMKCEDYVSPTTTASSVTTENPTTGGPITTGTTSESSTEESVTTEGPVTTESTTSTDTSTSTTASTTELVEVVVAEGEDEFVIRKEHEEYSSFLEPVIYSMMAGCIIIMGTVALCVYRRKYLMEQQKNREVDLASKSKMTEDESPETSSKTNESMSGEDGNSDTLGSSQSDDIDV